MFCFCQGSIKLLQELGYELKPTLGRNHICLPCVRHLTLELLQEFNRSQDVEEYLKLLRKDMNEGHWISKNWHKGKWENLNWNIE